MIISASRRTDIPCCYTEWLFNRLKDGWVLVPNPRNTNRLGRAQGDGNRYRQNDAYSEDRSDVSI